MINWPTMVGILFSQAHVIIVISCFAFHYRHKHKKHKRKHEEIDTESPKPDKGEVEKHGNVDRNRTGNQTRQ